MAKLRKGILGPLTGKIGPVIASTWKNTVYIRAMPQRKTWAATPAQLANQQKFKFIHGLLRPLRPYITVGFHHLATDVMEINLAFSIAYRKAISGTYPDLVVDYSQLAVSAGRTLPLINPVMVLAAEQTLILNWEVEWRAHSAFGDQVMLVVFCPELGIANGFTAGVHRGDERCTFDVPPRMVGHEIHVYAGVLAVNGKQASNSQYLGKVIPV